jgi:hypothetical protein
VNGKPYSGRSLVLYGTLQTLVLIFCWGWFAALWSAAFFRFTLTQIEWWLLVASACAGLYGLRPNLERAIDSAWLGKPSTPAVLNERAAYLKPIKRRIDLVFSVIVIAILVALIVLWYSGVLRTNGT